VELPEFHVFKRNAGARQCRLSRTTPNSYFWRVRNGVTSRPGNTCAGSTGVRDAAYDQGLRSYMLSVYNYMTSAVLLSGIVAYLVANTSLYGVIFGSPLKWVVMLAPLAFVFGINARAGGKQPEISVPETARFDENGVKIAGNP